MKKAVGTLALLVGFGLFVVPYRILGTTANAPGDGGPNFVPLFQLVFSGVGIIACFIVAYTLGVDSTNGEMVSGWNGAWLT
ncbi:hypothetical protein BH23VER1_BH23VER1_02120 [soil metagenome]